MATNINIIVEKIDEGVSLNTVFVRSFDDGYHESKIDVDDELLMEARRIRRRYKSFEDFYHAQAVFAEYMARLIDEYGGPDTFYMYLESDAVKEFVPPIPRMKNTKQNRRILELGVPISTYNGKNMEVDYDALEEIMDEFVEMNGAVDVTMGPNRVSLEASDAYERAEKVDGTVRSADSLSSLQAIQDYIHQTNRNSRRSEELGDFDPLIEEPLDEILSGEYLAWLDRLDEESQSLQQYRSRTVTKEEKKTLELSELLTKSGWNGHKIIRNMKERNGVDPTKDRASRIAQDVSKTQKKRLKRERKRQKKLNKQRSFYNDVLSMDDTFSDFENDVLDLSGIDIF